MERYSKNIKAMFAVFMALLIWLSVALFNLTIIKGPELAKTANNSLERTLRVTAKRGTIYDSTGIPLAYDETSYNVCFYREPTRSGEKWRALYTEVILDTIEIIERNGGKIINTFSIRRNDNGEFYFYWGGITNENAIRRREELWRSNLYINSDATAEEAYQILRQRYCIPDELDYETAHKVLSIWQEVQNYSYKSYVQVVIAYNVNASTVAEITQRSNELMGMSAVQSYTRVYPRGSTAAHVIGYMSKVYSEEKLADMKEKGYNTEAFVGVTGVESSMEEVLSSEIGTRVGEKVVEVNSLGKVVRVMSETKPTQGNNITLTIDAELQGKVEEVLANAIGTIRAEQQRIYNNNLQKYQNKEAARGGTKTRFASTGAAIVMNVNTCEVLAMASHPSFDLNLFTGGISAEDYAVLNDEETTPLFNKAISSRAEPGSIFKMLTAYAGLAEGVIDPNEQIDCLGEYSVAVTQGKAPACWQKNIIKHKGENVVTALKDSCNYYFYTVADRLGIEKLNKWASIFGLSSKTGIELESEVKSHVANQNVLYDHTKDINSGQVNSKAYLVRKAVYAQIQKYGVLLGVEYTPEQMNTAATRIVQLVGTDDDIGPGIRSILREELGISESVSYAKRWHLEISSILYEITWNRIQTVLTGIGQSVTAITPIAIARYISAIANGGTVYEATIIKRITDADGNVVMENSPKVVSTLTDTNNYFAYIKEGMREVISPEDGGTAADIFDGFEYAVDMAAKTGTAQVSSIDLENTAWFVAYTPLENTEIAVVVYIPNGYKGAMAGYAARDIIGFYRDRQKLQTDTSVTRPEGLVE